jgi:hypothetical protein
MGFVKAWFYFWTGQRTSTCAQRPLVPGMKPQWRVIGWGCLASINGGSSLLDQPKRLKVAKSLTTSPLYQSQHVVLDGEEPT